VAIGYGRMEGQTPILVFPTPGNRGQTPIFGFPDTGKSGTDPDLSTPGNRGLSHGRTATAEKPGVVAAAGLAGTPARGIPGV